MGNLGGSAIWQRQLNELSPDFDVIAPELPGYGDSFEGQACETIDGYAQQVLSFLSDMGVERFHLLGHSMGGMIAQQMTAMAPERVQRLICYGTGPRGVLPDRFETIEQSRMRLQSQGGRFDRPSYRSDMVCAWRGINELCLPALRLAKRSRSVRPWRG